MIELLNTIIRITIFTFLILVGLIILKDYYLIENNHFNILTLITGAMYIGIIIRICYLQKEDLSAKDED